jgi:hypothetical protein
MLGLHTLIALKNRHKQECKTLIEASTPSRPTFKPPKYGRMMPTSDNP